MSPIPPISEMSAAPARIDYGVREPTPARYLTTAEVAGVLRTPAETIRYWRHIGKGPKSFKIGRRVLYALEDVEAFIAEARKVVA